MEAKWLLMVMQMARDGEEDLKKTMIWARWAFKNGLSHIVRPISEVTANKPILRAR